MFKKVTAFMLAMLMLLSLTSAATYATDEFDYSSYNYSITTVNYTYDSESGEWVPASEINAGETFRVRVFLKTNFYAGSSQFAFAFEDGVVESAEGTTGSKFPIEHNSGYTMLNFYINSLEATVVGDAAENLWINNGCITREQADKYSFITCSLAATQCKILDDSQWAFEFEMKALEGTKGKNAGFVILPGLIQSVDNDRGHIGFAFSETESNSATDAYSAFRWYENTPVLSTDSDVIIHNVTGEVYREGYNPETDKFSFVSASNGNNEEMYEEYLGAAGKDALMNYMTNPSSYQSFGMSALLAQLISGEVTPADFGAESIADITAESEIDGMTLAEYVERIQLQSYAEPFSPADCEDIYNAVYDYVYNGGDPVILNLEMISKVDEGWSGAFDRHLLAVGLSGNNSIIVYDPDYKRNSIIEFGVENGEFTNEWAYELYAWSGNNTFDENVNEQYFIGFTLYDSAEELSFDGKNVMLIMDFNASVVTGAERSSKEFLYTAEKGETVSVDATDCVEDTSIFISDGESSAMVIVPDGSSAEFSHSGENSSVVLENADSVEVRFSIENSDGEFVEFIITGEPTGDTVTVIRNGNSLTVDGMDTVEITAIGESGSGSKELVTNGESVTITVDAENIGFAFPKFTVKWLSDGEIVEEYSVTAGEELPVPDSVKKEGYTFLGWDMDIPDTMPLKDLTFNAVWEICVYDMIFDAGEGSFADGESIRYVEAEYGSDVASPEIPSREGYTFLGWDKDVPDTVPAKNTVFEAVWAANEYTVIFDAGEGAFADGENFKAETFLYGETVIYPENPSRIGYVFAGWDTEADKMPACDIEIKAIWEIGTFSLTFDAGEGTFADGESTKNAILEYNAPITAPEIPSREGYTFVDWDETVPDYMPDTNVYLTAVWEANIYDVTFDAVDGEFADGATTAVIPHSYNSYIQTPDMPVRAGYNFCGWSLDGVSVVENPGVMNSTEGMTFLAVWTYAEDTAYYVKTYTMTPSGEYAESMVYMTGVTDSLVNAEYTVSEGFVLNESKSTLSGNIKADGSLVLEVYLDRISYQVTVNGETADYIYGQQIEAPEAPEAEEGYEFVGWTDENGDEITFPITVDESFPSQINPVFKKSDFTVTWVIDGVSSVETYEFGAEIIIPSDPVKEGCTFIGWDKEIPGTMPAKNLVISAKFEKDTYVCPDCGAEYDDGDEYNAHLAYEQAKKNIRVEIKNNPGTKTIKYGETLRLTAVTSADLPEGTKICWYVNGEKKGEGETFNLKFDSGTKTVEVKITDSDDNVLRDASSNEISDSQKVTVKSGFFQKIISFFKNLFGMNRTIVQFFTKLR